MTDHQDVVCLGGGVTGLGVGFKTGIPVFEARGVPGGICASYHMTADGAEPRGQRPVGDGGFRFETGGGHWIFGEHPEVTPLLSGLVTMRAYRRRASIFLGADRPLIPYPLQFHLKHLGEPRASAALEEMEGGSSNDAPTMAEWVRDRFGETLTDVFFGPFHELYTAGLWTSIAPQDGYKSPLNMDNVRLGARGGRPTAGYNVTFRYPEEGLDTMCRRLAARCDMRYAYQAIAVDVNERMVSFANGDEVHYSRLISTLPLVTMAHLTGVATAQAADPFTSALVINIGATCGPNLPDDHWVYFPRSRAGFHRVGVYSNVDPAFLPADVRAGRSHCALYVERAFALGRQLGAPELAAYVKQVTRELQDMGYIGDVLVCDPTWIPVAYTWTRPGSTWATSLTRRLAERQVFMAGRYGRWSFQGITDSIAEGLRIGQESTAMSRAAVLQTIRD